MDQRRSAGLVTLLEEADAEKQQANQQADAATQDSSSNTQSQSLPPANPAGVTITRAQLNEDLERADNLLEANLVIPIQRENAALAAVQERVVAETERLARVTNATVSTMEQSTRAVQNFGTQFHRLDKFDEWLTSAAKDMETVVANLQTVHEMLQQ